MKKGLNALELIFTLFVLIVVVLVVVRMFITKMSLGGIEKPIQDISATYNFEAALSNCNSLCSKYTSDCSNVKSAVDFCLQKVDIDIDGNRVTGEKSHYNVVEGIPMCEDGIYCLHIKTDCSCGSVILNPETCLTILCDYNKNIKGLDPPVAMSIIKDKKFGVYYGTCKANVTEWKIKDWTPTGGVLYTSDWPIPSTTKIDKMGPDYWWAHAGYTSNSCT